jgi:hypothetical protein
LPPIQTVQPTAAKLPPYVPVEVQGGKPDAFYEPGAIPLIRDSVAKIITEEGPVPDTVLFKRVARAWGLERTGSRILERLSRMVPGEVIRTSDGGRTFYWPPGAKPDSWNAFRVADESEHSKRHVSDVSLEEIGALVKHLLEQSGSSTRVDLARTACRLLGMNRTPADAEARVDAAIKRLISAGEVKEDGGYLRT